MELSEEFAASLRTTVFCLACGAELALDLGQEARFCPRCGERIEAGR